MIAMSGESKRCPAQPSVVCDIVDECKPFDVPDRCPAMKVALERAREKSRCAPLCIYDGEPCDVFQAYARGRVTFGHCFDKSEGFVCDRFDADFNATLPDEFRKRL